jgi:hypothetical protein
MEHGVVAQISGTTFWRWLSQDALRPWRHATRLSPSRPVASWTFTSAVRFGERPARVLSRKTRLSRAHHRRGATRAKKYPGAPRYRRHLITRQGRKDRHNHKSLPRRQRAHVGIEIRVDRHPRQVEGPARPRYSPLGARQFRGGGDAMPAGARGVSGHTDATGSGQIRIEFQVK